MRVLLVNPPIRTWAKPNCAPLGLMYVASSLRMAGHQVEIFDANTNPEGDVHLAMSARWPDAIGIGGIITTYRWTRNLIEDVKSGGFGNIPIIVGGPLASSIPNLMLKAGADYLVMGEGEEAVCGLMDNIDRDDICQLHAVSQPADIDALPFPAWDLVDMDTYLENPVGRWNKRKWSDGGGAAPLTMNLLAGRGCPYRCKYCYHDFMGHKYRVRHPANVVAEMKQLNLAYGVECFHFMDDEFVAKRSFVHDFCFWVQGTGFQWGCTGRANLVTPDMLTRMKNCGCVHMTFGIESGSDKMLSAMDKRVTAKDNAHALLWAAELLDDLDYSIMLGYPGETTETLKETLDFCKAAPQPPSAVFFATPYPGTELYKMALEQGKIKDEEEYVLSLGEQGERIACNMSDLSARELRDAKQALEEL